MARSRRRLGADERGQMMLLAAFIFVLGLLAMSATLARLPILAKQVGTEQDRPLVAHVGPMLAGVDRALDALDGGFAPGLVAGTPAFDEAVRDLLEHLQALEAAQGYILDWEIACDVAGDPATARAHLDVTDGGLWVGLRTARFTLSACP